MRKPVNGQRVKSYKGNDCKVIDVFLLREEHNCYHLRVIDLITGENFILAEVFFNGVVYEGNSHNWLQEGF